MGNSGDFQRIGGLGPNGIVPTNKFGVNLETFTEVTKKVSTVENMSSTLEAFLPMSFNFCGQESWVSVDGGWRNFALYSGKSSCIKLGREHSIIFATLQV